MLYDEIYVVKEIKNRKIVVVGQLLMQELGPCRKVTVLNPEGIRRVGKHKLRLLQSVEEDLKNMDVRNWRRK